MKRIIEKKASSLTFIEYVQELALQRITRPIRKEAKKIAPLRHVGITKSRLLAHAR